MILKSIYIITIITIGVLYLTFRLIGCGLLIGIKLGLGIRKIREPAPLEERIAEGIVLGQAPLIATLAIITIGTLKSLELVDFSLWRITIPVIFDIIISAITIFIWKTWNMYSQNVGAKNK
jgi:hypothetical protein